MSVPEVDEEVVRFPCGPAQLWGICARPPAGVVQQSVAVVIAVGGPQYRVGSHRQFTLLARRLAAEGFPTLRFDCRGMGDSEGDFPGFEHIGPDLHAAIDAARRACPEARHVVVWGLCDAASAAMIHAVTHKSVIGIVAVNPWARSEASLAAARVKHYYFARLMERSFWNKLLRGGLDWRASIGALYANVKGARSLARTAVASDAQPFQVRMARGLAGFSGRLLLIMAENDLTAHEFLQYTAASAAWRGLLDGANTNVMRVDVPQADHTFSSRAWRGQVEDATIAWLQGLSAATR
jgi:exosortase A-associated hydrolase 1